MATIIRIVIHPNGYFEIYRVLYVGQPHAVFLPAEHYTKFDRGCFHFEGLAQLNGLVRAEHDGEIEYSRPMPATSPLVA